MLKPPKEFEGVPKPRCAVYTWKYSEEGLEQEFNNLHAQREACEAYIASQRSEGWVLVSDQHDDGGISGGALERPGLKRPLEDIEDCLVDVVVVYKIDRLSLSLADFAKLVEVFDRNGATFVSVIPTPSCQRIFRSDPCLPRKTKRSPACGSCPSDSCTVSASPVMPGRMEASALRARTSATTSPATNPHQYGLRVKSAR